MFHNEQWNIHILSRTLLSSTGMKYIGRMDTYPENRSTTVSWDRRICFLGDYEGYTTGSFKTLQSFGMEITLIISNNKLNRE